MKKFISLLILGIMTATAVSAQNNPNVFTYKAQDGDFILLSEGQNNGNVSLLIGATPEILGKTAPNGTFPMATNAFLVKVGGFNILIDTGNGRELFKNLESAGVTPADINAVLITHMHGDHIGGMLVDGKPAYPNAMLYLAKPEHDYWMNATHGASQRKVIEAYKGRLELFVPAKVGEKDASIISGGIYPMQAYGHTPGHTAFLLESGNDRIMVWGDLTHAMAVQMPYPQVALTYDVDADLAIKARAEILEYVAKNNIPVVGMHIAYPAMGTVTANPTGGYSFTPMK